MQVVSTSPVALAIAQETMRVKPPFKILSRRTTKDIAIGDIAVPKDTVIFMCPRKVWDYLLQR